MENNPKEMKKYNPVNQFGSYEEALNFLKKIHQSCEKYKAEGILIWEY